MPGTEALAGASSAPRRTSALVVPAPAKVNLFLHVVGRRADGYHELESLMVLVDLHDRIELTLRDDSHVSRARPVPGVAEDDDLSIRAARALAAATGCTKGVDVAIEKRVPQGGGLGGGSSDAASVLLGLNRLWALHCPRTELARIGATLGADVPFFIGGESAMARGIGERLAPVSAPTLWIALACPDTLVPTASIFADAELTRSTPSAKIDVFSEGYGRNDLQAVASARFPAVADAIAAFERSVGELSDERSGEPQPSVLRMTGSGACVVAAFAAEGLAQNAVARLPASCRGIVVRTLARHPLQAWAA
jgi:4-diphosphocytidyl-2-C-methyl-D-erythritol kinase